MAKELKICRREPLRRWRPRVEPARVLECGGGEKCLKGCDCGGIDMAVVDKHAGEGGVCQEAYYAAGGLGIWKRVERGGRRC